MSVAKKAQMMMLDLKERLQKRLPSTYVFAESSDAQGPRLLISQDATPAAGEQVIAIRLLGVDVEVRNIFDNKKMFGPIKAQVIEEASTVSGVSLITLANRIHVDLELARLGLLQERYMTANGTAPDVSMFQADGSVSTASLIASVSPDLYWPLLSQ
ncbi:MAG: hypothetical protein QXT45_07780 [Candidatus Bilamarchaeaceae archaeon]